MPLDSSQTAADQALLQLGKRLRADGYHFTCVTPATHALVNARPGAEKACTVRDVFGWSRPFAASMLSDDELDLMKTAGVVNTHRDLLASTVRWSTLDGVMLVHSAYPTQASDAVFFGPDSYRFAHVIQDHLQSTLKRIERAVDIGCGTGVGALVIARAAQHAQVTAVDINPNALRFAAVNTALADVSNVSVQHSNILQDVTGQFDLIVANPPYMLDDGERTYRHGGGSLGADLSRRIIEQSLARLTVGGSLLLYTGVAIVEGQDALLEGVREQLAGPEFSWVYREIDTDVFGEQLLEPGYERVERIAAVALTVTRNR